MAYPQETPLLKKPLIEEGEDIVPEEESCQNTLAFVFRLADFASSSSLGAPASLDAAHSPPIPFTLTEWHLCGDGVKKLLNSKASLASPVYWRGVFRTSLQWLLLPVITKGVTS